MESKQLAEKIAHILNEKKAQDIQALKIQDLTVLADYFVLATGTSNTQVRALADEVEFVLAKEGIEPLHSEGYETKSWILLDYNSVIVHIFYPDARKFYDLERLWADAVPVELNLE